MAFKGFYIFSSGGHLVYRSKTILAILVGSHLGIIRGKFKLHWPKGLGGELLKQIIYVVLFFSSGGHFVHQSKTVLDNLVEGYISNISLKFE